MRRAFITGTAGFIGFHLAHLLLDNGFEVHGYDGMTDYYDVGLKRARHNLLKENPNFVATEAMLEDMDSLAAAVDRCGPDVIIHLAAQAGVRYSIENPRSYLESNVVGTFNVMQCAQEHAVSHLLLASTSSVYGANTEMPFTELQKADSQMSFYAATKKATESMAHSWSHIHKIPTTMFRFFTVYGPWGRPDMALFKFTKAILAGTPIDIYNNGDMARDFTFVDDIVESIRLLIDAVPGSKPPIAENDSLSPVAPFRIVNIGSSQKVQLLEFVEAIEKELGIKASRNYMPIQQGDVLATWADNSLLNSLTGYADYTPLQEGVAQFVSWYRSYYQDKS